MRVRTSPRAKRVALLFGSLVLSFIVAEGVLRIGFPQVGKLRQLVVPTDDGRGFAPKPNLQLTFEGVFEPLTRPVIWRTNSLGIRHDGEVGPPDERFRVAAYGDSETFGWAVAFDETFERQMEILDPGVEVLNLGVPGYNVTNVRHHMERTLPQIRPDLAIYLVNKNDFNAPVHFTALSYSHVLLHLRFLWHFSIGKQLRLAVRDESDRREIFGREVERMTRLLEARDTPFLVAFLKWKNRKSISRYDGSNAGNRAIANPRFYRQFVNVQKVVKGEPKEDTHYVQSAHRKMAALLCDVISNRDARTVGVHEETASRCVPSDSSWRSARKLTPR